MPIMNVKVSYLEMLAPRQQTVIAPRGGLSIIHAVRPTLGYYRFLYNAVGRDYHWHTRGRMPDAELDALLQNSGNEVHVLHVDGTPAGFAELDRRRPDDIELVQFGLMREFIGQGLGKHFLQWTIDKAWSFHPRRFWLHTCTLDHPRALRNYLNAGFALYKEEMIQRDITPNAKSV
jgi:GNAT superfamily N-acetyltransferase